jgi:hypothetical protein
MVNALLYSVYGQSGGDRHVSDPGIVDYRNRWLEALLTTSRIEAVVAFGHLADTAWQAWTKTGGPGADLPYRPATHPTQPESSSGGDPHTLAAAYQRLLTRWNEVLTDLAPAVAHPDAARPLELFDVTARPPDVPIPPDDLPAGCPPWMRSVRSWAGRAGTDQESKRATIVVTVPTGERPWHAP